MRSTLGARLLTLIVVAGCAPVASPSASPSASSPSASGPLSSAESPAPSIPASPTLAPTLAPTPSPLQAPTPRPSLVPAGELAWDPLETTGLGLNSITAALSFAGAYLVIGSDEDGLSYVARSTDGRHWAITSIGAMVQPCAGWVPRPDSSVYAAASDRQRVVLVGIEFAKDANPCDTEHTVAWVSTDGLSWQRSTGFGAVDGHGSARSVWPIPGGWEVLVAGIDSPSSIWRSADGLEWQEVGVVAPADWDGISVSMGASADGTRLLSRFNNQCGEEGTIGGLGPGESRLESSIDGVHWTSVNFVPPICRGAGRIVGPGPTGPSTWLLVADAFEDQRTMTYTSSDLQRWEQGTFPRHGILALAITRYGFIAHGATNCPAGSGDSCSPDPIQYLSTDGLHWTPFASSVPSVGQDGRDIKWVEIVDGPAGVLAISNRGSEVWRLRQ